MTLSQAFLFYLVLTPIAFFVFYANSIDGNGRLFYQPKSKFYQRALLLLWHDFFEVHCPWSWEVAKRHRLNDMRTLLGEQGAEHQLLGHLVASDCDNPERQEEIAKKTYVPRYRFWGSGVMQLITAVPRLAVLVIVIVVSVPISFGLDAWYLRKTKNK